MNQSAPKKDYPYINDTWTARVNGLGYQHLRRGLADLVVRCETPFAAAIYGGWGSGKTSLLRSTMAALGGELLTLDPEQTYVNVHEGDERTPGEWEKEENLIPKGTTVKTVWFNPWQHQFEAHPMIALLHEIRSQFSSWIKVKSQAEKTGWLAAKTGLRKIDDLIGSVAKLVTGHALKANVDKIEKDAQTYEADHLMGKLDSQRFQMHFETAVSLLISDTSEPDESGRLVIFIDDLDRCENDQAFKLLESIKLYLSSKRCVFVLGLDPIHTTNALTTCGFEPMAARQYLHKLFQMTFQLPRSQGLPGFIENLLEELNKDTIFELDEPKTKKLADLLGQILEGNPRRIKNFLNSFFFRGNTLKLRDKKCCDPMSLAYLMVLRFHYPEVYRYLEEDRGHALGEIKKAMKAENQPNADNAIQRWLRFTMYIPHYEKPDSGSDSEARFEKLETAHHTDQNALFSVLRRFKLEFRESKLDSSTLEHYLKP